MASSSEYRIGRSPRSWRSISVYPEIHWMGSPAISAFSLRHRNYVRTSGTINNAYVSWYNNKTGASLVRYPVCTSVVAYIGPLAMSLTAMDFPT